MASITKYAGTITQTTGGKYATFSSLNYLKNNASGQWAHTVTINVKTGTPNRPSTISLTNFNFNLPTGAEINNVKITYRHRKTGKLNIGAPTISLLGVSGFSSKGVAPSKTTMTTSTKTFSGSALTRAVVNSSSFGVKVNYPANSNKQTGIISISYITITVDYKVPSYSLNLKKVSGGYNEEGYVLEASISNKNLTNYNPTLTLTCPAGFSLLEATGAGTYTVVNTRTITWNPKLTSKTGTATIQLKFNVNVTFPQGVDTYTGTFTLVESLYSTLKNFTATITTKPAPTGSETSPDETWITDEAASMSQPEEHNVNRNEEFYFNFTLEEGIYSISAYSDSLFAKYPNYEDSDMTPLVQVSWNEGESWSNLDEHKALGGDLDLSNVLGVLRCREYGQYAILIHEITSDGNNLIFTPIKYVKVNCIPLESELSNPCFAIIEIDGDERDRLGDGYEYVVQSYMKQVKVSDQANDWYKNNRIGVYNNNIDGVEDYTSLTPEQIYENVKSWSSETAPANSYGSVEADFIFDVDYPLYVVITGDYPETQSLAYEMGTLRFTEPCIIEKEVYNGWEPTGSYPEPIMNVLTSEDTSQVVVEGNRTLPSVFLYDFPLDEEYGTTDDLAIRGIQVNANIEQTDNMVCLVKLHSPNGDIGQRSIVLSGEETELIVGGLGDLFGFKTLEMKNLKDWQVELSFTNILTNSQSSITYNDVSITFYVEQVEHYEIEAYVEDENLSYYGAFIENLKLPEGLETDTSFLTIDGTDTNDAYRQNIREKTIELEFHISACDIKTSADMLRQLTRLLLNAKDQYNRPIPKRIRFSHYPDVYYEYIIEDSLNVETEVTGYQVTAKLTIPAGTSYSLEDVVTNTVGNVKGLAAVNPIIQLRPGGQNIQVNETVTGQSFNIGYSGDWEENTVEIDCEDRKVFILQDGDTRIDISRYVDYNSDWFRLSGEFEFEGINCTILTVTFNERW